MPKLRNLYKLADPEIRAKNVVALKRAVKGMVWTLTRPEVAGPVFVVGCSRSGTTVTYETIAASPRLLSLGHEIPEFWNGLSGPATNGWASEAAGKEHAKPEHRDAALRFFYQRLGAGRVLDKTCINVMRIPYLHALFPDARFVFIQRDGRDNVSSMIDGWREHGHFGLTQFLGPAPCEVRINDGEFTEWSFFLPPGWREYNRASLEEVCAYQWITANRLALDARREIPAGQWIHLRYEDIFERPVEMFREVFERLDIPFDDALRDRCATLNRRPTSIVKGPPHKEKWRTRNPEMIERILPMIAPMMKELGYETSVRGRSTTGGEGDTWNLNAGW
ncbi:MAG: sulfotransferase family protein [Betaproteobacteria bacterium CG2_30_68_42]|nr:MAG: sulfotransferase family protein [Betaproteobacteria bacterium CG2_30_68_42]